MKQALKANDPRLTAYALGELSREESAEIAQQLKGNPELQKEVNEIDALGLSLAEAFGSTDTLKLSPTQRATVYQSGRIPTSDDVVSIHKKQWLRPVIVTLGAAAVITLSFAWLNNMAGRDDLGNNLSFAKITKDDMLAPVTPNQSKWNHKQPNNGVSSVSSNTVLFDPSKKQNIENMSEGLMHHPAKLRDAIEKTAASQPEFSLPEIKENNWVARADKAMSRLPLVCGNSSWQWMQQWAEGIASNPETTPIRPNKNAVRIEEILNHFRYTKPADIQVGDLHTGVSIVQCPWDPSHQIAVVVVQNRSSNDAYAEAAVTMSASVSKYRLIGYAKTTIPEAAKTAPARVKVAPGYSHISMFEIQLSDDTEIGDDVLTVTLNSESETAPGAISSNSLNIQHSDQAWAKAPQDVQFSLILASWAQIVADSEFDGEMNAQRLLGMMRYFEDSQAPSKTQREALSTIKLSLPALQ